MRRKIALMMVLVFVVGLLPPLSISAAQKQVEPISITELSVSQGGETAKGIEYSEAKGRFDLVNIGETEEVAMKWAIGDKDHTDLGKYTISYYLLDQASKKTNRIEIDFNVGQEIKSDGSLNASKDTIGIEVRRFDSQGTGRENAIPTQYQQYKSPYEEGEESKLQDFFIHNIKMTQQAHPSEKELKLKIENYKPIKLYYEDKQIYLSIDNVKKGDITPIKLTYTGTGVEPVKKAGGFVVFKGLDSFKLAPTHLLTTEEADEIKATYPKDLDTGMSLPSQKVIRMEQIGEGETKVPGSRPGVVVSFKKPRVIDEATGQFISIDTAEGKAAETKAKLLLMKKYSSDSTEEVGDRTYAVTFGFTEDNRGIYKDEVGAVKDGEIVVTDDAFEIYFATDDYDHVNEAGENLVHKWKDLKSGMILDAHIDFQGHYFNGEYFEGEDEPKYIVTTNASDAEKSGNTYMWYNIARSGKDTVNLQIRPYDISSGKITYNLYREAGEDFGSTVAPIEVRHYDGEQISDLINISTDMIDGTRYYFLNIQINGGNNEFNSQIVSYSAKDAPIPAPYPEIKSIDNVYVIANEDPSQSHIPESIGMDITWTVPQELRGYLKGGNTIYYELFVNNAQKGEYTPIKVFKVSEDEEIQPGSNQPPILVEAYAGTVNGETPEAQVARYDATKGTITVKNIVLKLPGSENWEALKIKPESYLDGKQYPQVKGDPTQEGVYVDKDSSDLKYRIPNTYYFKMRSVYEKKDAAKLGASGTSDPSVLSLNVTNEVLPTVTGQLLAQDISRPDTAGKWQYGGAVSFAPVNLERYIKYMLEPSQMYLSNPESPDYEDKKHQRIYEIYLSKSHTESINPEDIGTVVLNDEVADLTQLDAVFKKKDEKGNTIEWNQNASEALREGKTLKLEKKGYHNQGAIELVEFNGLDSNTPYYARARVKVERWKRKDGRYQQIDSVYSIYSKYVSFTTGTRPTPPTPDEKYPPAPDDFSRLGDASEPIKNVVKLSWKEPEFANTAEGDIHYEIVRSESQVIKDEHNKRSVSIDKIIDSQKAANEKQYKVFSTQQRGGKDGYLEYYDYNRNNWENVSPLTRVEDNKIEDNTLLPNTIYYYYIRTVHKINTEELRSEWIMIPITSTSLDRPVNLKVESEKDYKHDTTDEIVISFLAPIPRDKSVGAGKEYDFEIAIKGEEDEQYYTANASDDDRSYTASNGKEITINDRVYRKFVYTISGLEHATRYDIKVRIVDRTQGAGKEIMSLYSDKIIARTDFDQEEDDKENAYNKYLEKYDKETEKLKKEPVWKLDSKAGQSAYKYRETYIDDELGRSKTYTLQVEEDTTHIYYYLPIDTFEIARKANTMVEVELGAYKVHLRAGVLKGNSDIEEAIEKIEKNKAEDAYIALEISLVDNYNKINGSKPLTKEININMDIIFMDEEDRIIEDMIMEDLMELIEDGREDVLKILEREVKDGKIAEERLDAIIQDEIDSIKEKHAEKVRRILEKEKDSTRVIENIQKPILLVGKVDAFAVNGYHYNGYAWEGVTAFQTANGFGMDINKLGSYILTGVEGVGTLVPTIPGASDLISKYHLTDFFAVDPSSLSGYVTKEQLYGSVARMIGAQRGTDYVLALQNRGIKLVMPQNVYQTVRYDEAIFVTMQAYEKMYYKPIQSIHISNKQSVQNIAAFQPQYRPYVYAAVELGIIKTDNYRLNPAKAMTVEELLRMLTKMMPR